MKSIVLFGHRKIYKTREVEDRLFKVLEEKVKEGFLSIKVGTHGEFDKLAIGCCKALKRKYPELDVSIVFTTLTILKKDEYGYSIADNYKEYGFNTCIYDIEEEHFKRQITRTNQLMVNNSDLVICYVNMEEYRSGAKTAVKYAQKLGKEIINIYREEDKPFYGMTREEIDEYWEKLKSGLN